MTATTPDLSAVRSHRTEVDRRMGWHKRMDDVKLRAVLWGGIGVGAVAFVLFLLQISPKIIGPVVTIGAILVLAPFFLWAEKTDKLWSGLREGLDCLAAVVQPGPVPGHVFALFVVDRKGLDDAWLRELAGMVRDQADAPPSAEWVTVATFLQHTAVADARGGTRRMRLPQLPRSTSGPAWLIVVEIPREAVGADLLALRVAFEQPEAGKVAQIAMHVAKEAAKLNEFSDERHGPTSPNATPTGAAVIPPSCLAAIAR